MALVVGAVLVLWACTSESRYRVLSLVFDGVPEPGTEEAPLPTRADLLTPGEPAAVSLHEEPAFYASVHRPYARRHCDMCHDQGMSNELIALDQTLCIRCHGERLVRETWDHGPLNLGLCRMCHEPHLSAHPNLESQPQPALCTQCHQSSSLMTEIAAHVGEEERRCTDCHDPHRSGMYVVAAAVGGSP